MVALTIGLVLVLGLAEVFIASSRNFSESQKYSQQIENGRYAMEILSEDIRHAGFFGETSYFGPPPATPPDACVTDVPTLTTTLPMSIYGVDGPDATPSCLPERVTGTDVLVVRRANTAPLAAAGAVAGEYYTQTSACSTDLTGFRFGTSGFTMLQKDCATAAPIRKFHTSIYFISPCSLPSGATGTCAANPTAPAVPTLTRMELGSAGFALTPLVEGIENMQFEYGLDGNADGAPDTYTAKPANTGAAWASVAAVRLHVLARNVDATAGLADTKTYHLGKLADDTTANDATPGGQFKRHLYTGVVRVVNMSQRNEPAFGAPPTP